MYFEIVGEITHVETFAVGSSIREIERLRKLYGRGGGGNERALPRSNWPMEPPVALRYTGTRQPASGAAR